MFVRRDFAPLLACLAVSLSGTLVEMEMVGCGAVIQ